MPTSKDRNLDTLTSVNEDGSRYFLHPSDTKGPFILWRRVFGALLIAIYVLLPWIPIGGFPAVFLDLAERRFHFFGLTFLSEDLWIGFFLFTGLGFSLFYVTALFGRLWCGWACPYTVFLEHLYRRVERIIDGDAANRRKLDAAPWTKDKIIRRLVKHGVYLILSLLIANVFISYFVSIPKLYQYIIDSPLENFKTFGVMLFLTGALYFSFSWFREQFCIILCPYGRIQSALTDDETVVIGYDEVRGEPRGKKSDPTKGDCIGCNKCVQVCPTGIDIRNGLQLECIGCAACIDACNGVMEKIKRPLGLIRYDSYKGLQGEKTRLWRPRIALYTAFIVIGLTVLTLFLTSLHNAKLELVRMSGNPYYVDDTNVRNQYRLQLVTKQNNPTTFDLSFENLPEGAFLTGVEKSVVLTPGEETTKTIMVQIPKDVFDGEFTLKVKAVVSPGDFSIEDSIEFLGPSPYTLRKE